MKSTNTFVYHLPFDYDPSIWNKAIDECKKYCEEMRFDTTAEFLRFEATITFKSYSFEGLIVIYCILKKAEMEAAGHGDDERC